MQSYQEHETVGSLTYYLKSKSQAVHSQDLLPLEMAWN